MTLPHDPSPLKIVMVGHVDHGKSTLIGRLLHETGSLPEGKLEQLHATCQRRGVPLEWAFLLDALQAERDQNITLDAATLMLRTARRSYALIDAPGHHEFIKNMVTGAADAHAALVLLAVDEGVQEQTRRHAALLRLLGIRSLVVLINKMDRVDYDEASFARCARACLDLLEPLQLRPAHIIPISARHGQLLVAPSPQAMPWYHGPTVLQALDALERPAASWSGALRLPIQDVYRFDHRRVLAGRVEAGQLQVGDTLRFYPGQRQSVVRSIERWSAQADPVARRGQSIGITLETPCFVERGQIAARLDDPPLAQTDRLRATLFWLGQRPLTQGLNYTLRLATQEARCQVERILAALDASTLAPRALADDSPRQLLRHEIAELTLRAERTLAFDLHAEHPATGRFVLIQDQDVCGGGLILQALPASQARREDDPDPQAERRLGLGHRGAVLMLPGPPWDEALGQRLALALTERSFMAWRVADALAPDASDEALAAAALALARVGVLAILDCPEPQAPRLAAMRRLMQPTASGWRPRPTLIIALLHESATTLHPQETESHSEDSAYDTLNISPQETDAATIDLILAQLSSKLR